MDLARVLGRAHAQPLRLPALAAGALGLLATAAVPGAVPHTAVTSLPGNLQSVSGDSPSDAWAAGVAASGVPLVLHWTGASWTPVTIPGATTNSSAIAGLSALSATDAWAVGSSSAAAGGLIAHWDGTSWTQVPSPAPTAGEVVHPDSVSAVSATSAFAVGFEAPGGAGFTDVALSWNGTTWSEVPVPSPSNQSGLNSVSADSPSDAWAVGDFSANKNEQSMIMHWNGTSWTQVPSPNPSSGFTSLSGVSALSSNDAWAVGSYVAGTRVKTLVLHWNGSDWTQVPSPTPDSSASLASVSALSASDAWAVGSDGSGTLVLHWNGTSWTRVPSPNPGRTGTSDLQGVSAVSSTDAWSVGCQCGTRKNATPHTVILRWNGTAWVRS